MQRKAVVFFSCVIVLFGALFVFRHQFLVLGTKAFLKSAFGQTLVYEKIAAKEGKVCIQGLHVTKERIELALDHAEFELNFQEVLMHPKRLIELYRLKVANWSQLLIPMKQYGMNTCVQNGVLKLDQQRYYFQFRNGEKTHEIGTLLVSHDPGLIEHPFLVVQFHMRGDQLISQLVVEEVPSERLLHLAAFAFPEQFCGFEEAQGVVEMRANVIFEKDGHIDEVSSRFTCENFEVHYPRMQLALHLGNLTGDLTYPEGGRQEGLPVWKQMQCSLSLEKGNVSFGKKFAVTQLEGKLVLDPHEDPNLSLKGELAGQEKSLALQLEGKGAMHEDHAYWLEFGLNLNDATGTMCDAFLSICRPEKESLVVQIEASNLLPGQVEMLKGYFAKSMPRLKEWEVQQGSFGGKLIAVFEKGNLSHFEIQDFLGENVALSKGVEPLFFSHVKGEGRLFEELNFELDLPVAHFFAFISDQMKEAYGAYRPDDFAHLSTKIVFGNKEVETLASVEFLPFNESIQFGFKSKRPFPGSMQEIKEGWARSEKLSYLLYGPFVHLMAEDLKLYGDIDLLTSYDGKQVEFALQIDHFLSKHPLLDLKADAIGEKEKTAGRAKFIYDVNAHTFEGKIPFRKAMAYERRYGLFFDELDGELILLPNQVKGHISHADVVFQQSPLLKKAEFDFSFTDTFALKDLTANLALQTDKEYRLEVSQFDPKTCDFSLFDEKLPLAHFKGTNNEAWEGVLSLNQLSKDLQVQFSWDPLADVAYLHATGEQFDMRCKKVQGEYCIESLQVNDTMCKAVFSPCEEGFILPLLEVSRGDTTLQGSGTFFIDLAQSTQSFGIRSDLNLEVEWKTPVPLKLKATHPLRIAYSLDGGFILSDLDFTGDGAEIQIDHFEHTNGKVTARKIAFDISEEKLNQFFDVGAMPHLLRDFRICKGLKGNANLGMENGALLFTGALEGTKGKLDVDLKWKNHAGTLSLGTDEKLTFDAEYDLEGLHFKTIKGSYGRLNADLKKHGKQDLKGVVKLDFSLFDELFDLPLSTYITKWKAGGGYQFDGVFTPQKRLSDWSFKGQLKGNGFECGGYQVRSLEAKIEVEPGQITIENLDLTDDAGKMWIGEGALMRSGPGWMFSFPLVEIRGFQPSFLHKMGGPEKPITPLIIKSATLQDVRGRLDNPMTISATGNLRFTNSSKKGERHLPKTLPSQVLEQMGLEESLFVPASGEMEYVIQNGRCYLREIHSVMSDQNRSEFIPPRSGVMGYLDFDGNLFIDLQVKQKSNKTITSPVSLKVRGTWEEPELNIR
ncbi:MAG: hypothetical protein K1000chlam2_00471 [Chlamydiae bacterium]|nr:hypothetical protein [Chlamydiota bacterium]